MIYQFYLYLLNNNAASLNGTIRTLLANRVHSLTF